MNGTTKRPAMCEGSVRFALVQCARLLHLCDAPRTALGGHSFLLFSRFKIASDGAKWSRSGHNTILGAVIETAVS